MRNRILDFAIAVWKEAPAAGEGEGKPEQIESTRVTQIFNTTVHGGAASIIGAAVNSAVGIAVSQNDMASLEKALTQAGIALDDIKDLGAAMVADGSPKKNGGFGARVSEWIAGMMKKAADGSWKVGFAVAGDLLAKAISKYYGL